MIYVATLSRRAARNASRDEEVRKKAAAVAEKKSISQVKHLPESLLPPTRRIAVVVLAIGFDSIIYILCRRERRKVVDLDTVPEKKMKRKKKYDANSLDVIF